MFFHEKILHTKKRIKSTKSIKITKVQISEQVTFLPLDIFMCIKMLPCLFLFTYMRFVLFVLLKFSRKKKMKRFKIVLIASFTLLLTCTPLNLPIENLFARTYFYLWSSVRIFPFCENLLNLFLFMIICENLLFLWESFESFFIYDQLFNWKSSWT